MLQKTIKNQVFIEGIGLHSGKTTHLTISAGRPNQGIVFIRTDLEDRPMILGHFKNVMSTQLATTIGRGKLCVATVEHIMAALYGAGVDNATVEVDGPEIPVLDGSAEGFYRAILEVGTVSQLQLKTHIALRRRIEVKVDDKWAVAVPSKKLQIHASIEWDHPVIGYQEFHYREGKTKFSEISNARTFGFVRDLDSMKRMGLAQGGSLKNAIVLDEARVVNEEGLRYSDEFVRHKVLDALGDFKLAGVPLVAAIRLHRAGHDLHHRLLVSIFKDPANYQLVGAPVHEEAPAVEEIPLMAAARG